MSSEPTALASRRRKTGVLLLNLGTPDAPSAGPVRRYLREFLSDPRVLTMPRVLRWLLLYLVILPTRPARSAAAYRAIWTAEGSPLLIHARALERALAEELGDDYLVQVAMRYGRPSIDQALERIFAAGVERLIVLPLFPQYASATTGSAVERVLSRVGRRWNLPVLETLPPFYAEPAFHAAERAVAEEPLASFKPDHVLFSFHGVPESHVRRGDPSGQHCLSSMSCCAIIGPHNADCYRAQCFSTARHLAHAVGLQPGRWSVSFQSRLGRTPWIRPYTEEAYGELAAQGVRRLAVMCPAFVADCLETLEEIGIRGRERWRELGGEELLLVPSLNAHPSWVQALVGMIRARTSYTRAIEPST